MKNKIVVKTLFGLENLLAEEIKILGADDIEIGKRSITCTADNELIYKINLHSRFGIRVLKQLERSFVRNENELYEFVKSIEWERYFKKHYTFAIDSTVHSDNFNHANYVALKTKDAVADRLRSKWNFRPDVDKSNPYLLIHVHVNQDGCDILLDSTGESLHKRGWRISQNDAPLNEILAAALVKFSGWTYEQTLIDGMCGSGTILMEAVSQATATPPGMKRSFTFQNWVDYDEGLFHKVLNEAKQAINNNIKLDVRGIEISQKAFFISKKNLLNSGFEKHVKLINGDFFKLNLDLKNSIIILNPPYGERLEKDEELNTFYKSIGGKLKYDYSGNKAWIFSSNFSAMKNIGLKPTQKIILYNGALECRYSQFDLFDGKLKDKSLS